MQGQGWKVRERSAEKYPLGGVFESLQSLATLKSPPQGLWRGCRDEICPPGADVEKAATILSQPISYFSVDTGCLDTYSGNCLIFPEQMQPCSSGLQDHRPLTFSLSFVCVQQIANMDCRSPHFKSDPDSALHLSLHTKYYKNSSCVSMEQTSWI